MHSRYTPTRFSKSLPSSGVVVTSEATQASSSSSISHGVGPLVDPCYSSNIYKIQGIHKRIVQFKIQKENYFSPYTGTTYTVSSNNCPSFSCATSSSLLMLSVEPRGQFPRWCRSRKRLPVCSVLR
jgi:hypothetical protein